MYARRVRSRERDVVWSLVSYPGDTFLTPGMFLPCSWRISLIFLASSFHACAMFLSYSLYMVLSRQ